MVEIEKTELSPGLTSIRAELGVVQVEHTLEDRYQIYKKLLENHSTPTFGGSNVDPTTGKFQPRTPVL